MEINPDEMTLWHYIADYTIKKERMIKTIWKTKERVL